MSRGDAILDLASDIGELILKGNEIGRDYNFDGTEGFGGAYLDAGLNISVRAPQDLVDEWRLESLYVGFTYHNLRGVIFDFEGQGSAKFDYGEEAFNPSFTGDGRFIARANRAEDWDDLAVGSALDLGALARLNDKYTIGFSAMNIGSMSATGVEYIEYELVTDEDGKVDFEEVANEFRPNEEIHWRLPTTFKMGAMIEQRRWLTLFTDYSYTDYHYGQKDHNLAAAAEIAPWRFLPLRTGLNYSTLEGRTKWAGGFGLYLGPIKADVGVSDMRGLFNAAKGVEAAANLRIQF